MSDPAILGALPLAAAALRHRRSLAPPDPLALRAEFGPHFFNEQQRVFFGPF
jgi:hypothetical protein